MEIFLRNINRQRNIEEYAGHVVDAAKGGVVHAADIDTSAR